MKHIEIAKELIEKFVNQPISFPYIDTRDGQCIGAGYMTYKSAKDCALIYADGMIKEHTWKLSTSFENAQKAKWESIKLALMSL
jgi:hypothetical protein